VDQIADIAGYVPAVLSIYAAFVLGMMSPGPNVLAVIGTSMSLGRREGTALALGIAVGSVCWAGLTSAGLATLLTVYAEAIVVIKLVGGLYLLWLGFKALRSAASPAPIPSAALAARGGLSGYLLRGLTIQLTNPKAALTWIAIMSLGASPNAPLWVSIAVVLGTGALSVVGHVLYARAFSTAPMVALYKRARRWIETLLGLFFCCAGVKLLASR
jgi:amino acid exporter